MNRFPPRLRLIKGGKRPPKPPSEFLRRLRDIYWEPYIMSTLLVMLLIFAVWALSQLK